MSDILAENISGQITVLGNRTHSSGGNLAEIFSIRDACTKLSGRIRVDAGL
jgi:hypothetical protein